MLSIFIFFFLTLTLAVASGDVTFHHYVERRVSAPACPSGLVCDALLFVESSPSDPVRFASAGFLVYTLSTSTSPSLPPPFSVLFNASAVALQMATALVRDLRPMSNCIPPVHDVQDAIVKAVHVAARHCQHVYSEPPACFPFYKLRACPAL